MTSGRSSAAAAAALGLASLAVAFLLTLVIEKCVGLVVEAEGDLVFDRYSVVNYSTPEFQATARINNFGFRGENLDPGKRKRYRIAALGDSFTFGWGVDFEETWPRRLEKNLRNRGLDVEVMNLGQPGAAPALYAEIAERALSVLKPDLVIVAVNQADDLGQIMRAAAATKPRRAEPGRGAWDAIKAALKWLYPNVLELRKRATPRAESATAIWKEQVSMLLSGLGPEENARLGRIDGEIKGMFIRGELNPGLLAASLHRPDEMWKTLDLLNPLVQKAIEEMSGELSRVNVAAQQAGAKVVVVSLPNGFFVSEKLMAIYEKMGYTIERSCWTTESMDEAVRMAALKSAVDFLEITRDFRKESAKRDLFFTFDLHYNNEGQRFFAETIAPPIAAKLKSADS